MCIAKRLPSWVLNQIVDPAVWFLDSMLRFCSDRSVLQLGPQLNSWLGSFFCRRERTVALLGSAVRSWSGSRLVRYFDGAKIGQFAKWGHPLNRWLNGCLFTCSVCVVYWFNSWPVRSLIKDFIQHGWSVCALFKQLTNLILKQGAGMSVALREMLSLCSALTVIKIGPH